MKAPTSDHIRDARADEDARPADLGLPAAGRAHPNSTRKRLRIAAGLAGVSAVVGLLGYGLLTSAPDDSIRERLGAGKAIAAPDFTVDSFASGDLTGFPDRIKAALAPGREVSLSELRGIPIVLNFWASWCDPCRTEAPFLQSGWRRHRGGGTLFLGLDSLDATGDARAFLDEFGITYPTIREGSKEVANEYGVTGFPETFFIDARGQIVAAVIGVLDADMLDRGVEAARTGTPGGLITGGPQGGTDLQLKPASQPKPQP